MRSRIIIFSWFFFLLGASDIFAEKSQAPNKGIVIEGYVSNDLFLYEWASQGANKVQGKPLPNRIHIRFSKDFDDWVFIFSDGSGHFPKPPEVLVVGSVFGGEMLGGPSHQNFKFVPGGRWVSTDDERKIRLVVVDTIPRFRVVTFEPVQKHKLEFVNPDFKADFSKLEPFTRNK